MIQVSHNTANNARHQMRHAGPVVPYAAITEFYDSLGRNYKAIFDKNLHKLTISHKSLFADFTAHIDYDGVIYDSYVMMEENVVSALDVLSNNLEHGKHLFEGLRGLVQIYGSHVVYTQLLTLVAQERKTVFPKGY